MRLTLTMAFTAALAACGNQPENATPERGTAAGEVLGGEVSDAMLPLDTVRSTSPAGPSSPDDGKDGPAKPATSATSAATDGARAKPGASDSPAPRRTFEAAPLPDMTMPADPEPLRTGRE